MLIVFSKDNCAQCTQLENLLKLNGKDYTTKKLGVDFNREDLVELFTKLEKPLPRSFPLLFKEDEFVGTLNEAKKAIMAGKL